MLIFCTSDAVESDKGGSNKAWDINLPALVATERVEKNPLT